MFNGNHGCVDECFVYSYDQNHECPTLNDIGGIQVSLMTTILNVISVTLITVSKK